MRELSKDLREHAQFLSDLICGFFISFHVVMVLRYEFVACIIIGSSHW